MFKLTRRGKATSTTAIAEDNNKKKKCSKPGSVSLKSPPSRKQPTTPKQQRRRPRPRSPLPIPSFRYHPEPDVDRELERLERAFFADENTLPVKENRPSDGGQGPHQPVDEPSMMKNVVVGGETDVVATAATAVGTDTTQQQQQQDNNHGGDLTLPKNGNAEKVRQATPVTAGTAAINLPPKNQRKLSRIKSAASGATKTKEQSLSVSPALSLLKCVDRIFPTVDPRTVTVKDLIETVEAKLGHALDQSDRSKAKKHVRELLEKQPTEEWIQQTVQEILSSYTFPSSSSSGSSGGSLREKTDTVITEVERRLDTVLCHQGRASVMTLVSQMCLSHYQQQDHNVPLGKGSESAIINGDASMLPGQGSPAECQENETKEESLLPGATRSEETPTRSLLQTKTEWQGVEDQTKERMKDKGLGKTSEMEIDESEKCMKTTTEMTTRSGEPPALSLPETTKECESVEHQKKEIRKEEGQIKMNEIESKESEKFMMATVEMAARSINEKHNFLKLDKPVHGMSDRDLSSRIKPVAINETKPTEHNELAESIGAILQCCDIRTATLKKVINQVESKLGRLLTAADRRQVKEHILVAMQTLVAEKERNQQDTDYVKCAQSASLETSAVISNGPATSVVPTPSSIESLTRDITRLKTVHCDGVSTFVADTKQCKTGEKEIKANQSSAEATNLKSESSSHQDLNDVISLLDDDSDVEWLGSSDAIDWKKVVERKKGQSRKENAETSSFDEAASKQPKKKTQDDSKLSKQPLASSVRNAANDHDLKQKSPKKRRRNPKAETFTKPPSKPSPVRKKRGAGSCQLCTSCPCKFAASGGSEGALDLATTDSAIEKALIRQLLKLEKTCDRYEEQTDVVRRKLKRHRREMWRKLEARKALANATGAEGRFLQDLEQEQYNLEQHKKAERLATPLVDKAKAKLVQYPPGYQPTLTQMMGASTSHNDTAVDTNLDTDNGVNDEQAVNDIETGEGNDHDSDHDSYIDDKMDVEEADIPPDCARINVEDARESGTVTLWENSSAGMFKCQWDQLFEDPCDAACIDFEQLQEMFDDVVSKQSSPASVSRESKLADDVDISMLSQRGQSIAEDIFGRLAADPEKLRSLDGTCRNWRENIMFAMHQRKPEDIRDALERVRAERDNLHRSKSALLKAIQGRDTALQLFETALRQSMARLDQTGASCANEKPDVSLSSPASKCSQNATMMTPGVAFKESKYLSSPCGADALAKAKDRNMSSSQTSALA